MEKSNASVCISKVLEKSGRVKIDTFVTAALKPSKAFWYSLLQTHNLFCFNNSVNGVALRSSHS